MQLMLLFLISLLGFSSANLQAVQKTNTAIGQEEAERRLSELQRDIAELQQRLTQSRSDQKSEQSKLRELDLSIQATAHRMRDLNKEKTRHLATLGELENKRDEYNEALDDRKHQLGAQIEASYRLSRQSRVKLILNQNNTARLSRMLAYYDHINRAQLDKISTLRALLLELEKVHIQIDRELLTLEAVQQEHEKTLAHQQSQRQERENLLAVLGSRIDNETVELLELERNRADLEELLERIGDALADIPANLGEHLGIAAQKGELPVPVKGKVRQAFGQKRTAGMKWHGWLLETSTGTEVSNIAYGRVAFSDWLRGYGLLMIIDHGQGFMSLYGYNESLLWEVGDWVEPGAVIATVGSSPGGDQGLYFELRKQGKAVDPAAWLKR